MSRPRDPRRHLPCVLRSSHQQQGGHADDRRRLSCERVGASGGGYVDSQWPPCCPREALQSPVKPELRCGMLSCQSRTARGDTSHFREHGEEGGLVRTTSDRMTAPLRRPDIVGRVLAGAGRTGAFSMAIPRRRSAWRGRGDPLSSEGPVGGSGVTQRLTVPPRLGKTARVDGSSAGRKA